VKKARRGGKNERATLYSLPIHWQPELKALSTSINGPSGGIAIFSKCIFSLLDTVRFLLKGALLPIFTAICSIKCAT